jgi:hypothetical protein
MTASTRLDGHAANGSLDDRAPVSDGPAGGNTSALLEEICHLRRAVVSRAQVGVACGLVASSYGCTTEQAFALLLRISQTRNIKLRQVALVLQQSFDGELLSDDQARILDVAATVLPRGWPPRQGSTS